MRYRNQRLPSATDLRVEYGDELCRAQLVNISTSGARLTQLGNLPPDLLVWLCYLNARYPARVVWSSDWQTGVRFVVPLSNAEVSALRGAGRLAAGWGKVGQAMPRELG